MSDCILYDYPKSSSSYRVRIGLNLAGITYQRVLVNLLADEQTSKGPEHRARNPQGLVPVLDIDGTRLTQSLAILDYLDSTRNLVLTPVGAAERARVLALAHSIAVDVQPVGNLSVLRRATNMQDPQRKPAAQPLDARLHETRATRLRSPASPLGQPQLLHRRAFKTQPCPTSASSPCSTMPNAGKSTTPTAHAYSPSNKPANKSQPLPKRIRTMDN